MNRKWIVGITGASGMVYTEALLKKMQGCRIRTDIIITKAGEYVWKKEMGRDLEYLENFCECIFREDEIYQAPASGSSGYEGMFVIPCSMGTLASLANGISSNLLERSADVMLKERRPLFLVIRETPLNQIHLENMLKVHRAGAVIFPAMPFFYHKPKAISELVDAFVERLLFSAGILSTLKYSWRGEGDF